MRTFDLFLDWIDDDGAARGVEQAVRKVLGQVPHLHAAPGDRACLVYYNPDTAVHFNVLLDPSLTPPPAHDDNPDSGVARGDHEPPDHDVLPDARDFLADSAAAETEEDGAAGTDAHVPPLSVNLPLLRPSFFVVEALSLIARLRQEAGVHIVAIAEDTGAGADGTPVTTDEAIAARWRAANEHAAALADAKMPVERWSSAKCREFFAYGSQRPLLAARYRGENIEVLPLQPAKHGGRTRTLCVWDPLALVVLPRADVILMVRDEERRGLFRRKMVRETVLVDGETVWRLLGPHAQVVYEPAPYLVIRNGVSVAPQVRESLARLPTEPASAARRCELEGVIDAGDRDGS